MPKTPPAGTRTQPPRVSRAAKPKTQKPAAAPKPSAPQDTNGVKAPKADKPSTGGKSLFGGIMDTFGGLGRKAAGSLKPLDLTADQKRAGQEASGTLDRLAGPDGQWTADDLGRNFAQLQFPRGIKGVAARGIAAGRLMESHGLDRNDNELRNKIMQQGRDLAEANPDIAKLAKLEGMDTSKFTDEQRQKYDSLVDPLRESLGEQGLLPVTLDQMQDFGDSADVLKEKLQERGIDPPPPGTPVDAGQFRGLFEGKPPIQTMF